jgi:hypothetical protein
MDDVAISSHTRKILWASSGNACAHCDTQLVVWLVAEIVCPFAQWAVHDSALSLGPGARLT